MLQSGNTTEFYSKDKCAGLMTENFKLNISFGLEVICHTNISRWNEENLPEELCFF